MALGKYVARIAALCIAATLAFVPVAGAYKLPKPPGSPGGPPNKPKGGTTTTKGVTTKVGNDLAGFTDTELAKLGKVTVNFFFPGPGTVSCTVKAGNTKLGAGTATATKTKGTKKLTITFSSSGKTFLKNHNGKSTTLTISCTFKPKKGKSATSTTTLKTFP
jgi:hypothetical protein